MLDFASAKPPNPQVPLTLVLGGPTIRPPRNERIARILLGIVVPLAILVWTLSQLFEDSAVLHFGRTSGFAVEFQGTEALVVSNFWFGASLGLFSHYQLKYKTLANRYRLLSSIYWLSGIMVFFGMVAGIWFMIVRLGA